MPLRFSLPLLAFFFSACPVHAAGTFSTTTLTGDANSGVAADSAFTHAINVYDAGNVKVNGAVFTGSGLVANPTTNNYSTTGFNNAFTGFDALANDGISGSVGALMTNFLYNGNPATVTLKNLRAGQQYEAVFYNAAFGGPGVRFQTITTTDGGSVVFDQNGIPGSLLKYLFTATGSSLTISITPTLPGNTFHQYAFSNRAVGLQALFTDNFYAPSNPSTMDLNFNAAARQGGSLVQSGGTIPWVAVANTQVGNTTGAVDAGNYLLTAFGTGNAALNHNFNGAETAGGISISFDLAPNIGAQAADNWSGIALGQASADKSGAVNGPHAHFGLLFRGNGQLQAFDGATNLTPVEPTLGYSAVTAQLQHFELLITDSIDANPFNGSGETRIEVFANGVSRYVYTKTGGGYANNFLNFQSSHIGGVDNLTIARLNATPAPPVFSLQPQGQSIWMGDALSLSVAATGYPAVSFQWYRDAVAISGATGSSYSIIDATGAGGSYTVIATNSQGSVTSNAAVVNVIAPTRQQRTWENAGPSSRRTALAISEIHYHPPTRLDGRNLEFIELYNSNPWMEELAGYRFTGEVDYTFPAGAQIPAKGYVVVAKVPNDVMTVYGLTGVFGGFTQSLSNEGGTLRLRKPSDAIVLEVSWNDHAPWPVAGDGTGHSIVLARPSYGEASAAAWDASPSIGGSPGAADAAPSSPQDHVVINEVLARSELPLVDFVELRNGAPFAVDISGCFLSDDPAVLGKYVIPTGTTLAGGGMISFTETQLGFALSAEGETLYFTNAAGTRVLDCVRFSGSAVNVSLGRANNREGTFLPLASSTPGTANSGYRMPEILISEIFYDPISGDDLDEWLELYNPGVAAVSVGGWEFSDGIGFTIPAGTNIAANGRLVIAKNAVRTRSNNPSVAAGSVVGDYAGTLANGGDRITLVRPETVGLVTIKVEVDSIAYVKAGRWSRWAAGGGSSLEVRDLREDRTLASAWADSDESAKSSWTTVSVNGPLDLGHSSVSAADRVQFFLMGAGETLVDNVTVAPDGTGNVVANGGFESGLTGWTLQGNQARSSLASGLGMGGGTALQVRASDDGEPEGNRIYSALTSSLAVNSIATLSANARWLRGNRELILRLRGGFLETLATLPVPTNLGTPGAANSRALSNAGPAIREVSHRPLLPPTGVPIRVFARVSDPDGIASVTLKWRLEAITAFTNVTMRDDGLSGDIFPNDGVYTGVIPAQNTTALIVFRVESTDAATAAASASFPPDAPNRECLVRVGETDPGGDFAAYRMWLTSANITSWTNREKFGNEPLDTTFIYGRTRAVYGCGVWYGGSEASTPGFNGPLGTLCGYNLLLPSDNRVLAEDHFTLDFPVRDVTDQREQLMFWMAEKLRLPNLHRRYVQCYLNGTRRSSNYDDVQQPDQTFIDQHFPNDGGGHLYKTNNWNEGADNANSTSAGVSNLLQHYDSGGQHKLARYRWNWRPRAASSANEFGDMFTLIDAVNATTNYQAGIEAVVDTENWMRTFAFHDLCSFWDAFGNPNTKNTYLYKPQVGRWTQFTWDMDVGLGVFNDPTNAALFPSTVDAKLDALQAYPAFRRIYWRTVHEALATFFSGTGVTPQLQKKYDALATNNLGLTSPFVASGAYNLSIPQWIDQRRTFLQTQLDTVAATFAITSAASVTVTTPSVTITGNAPVNVAKLTINGVEFPVAWPTVTSWSITLVPTPGSNPYVVRALDYNGAEIGAGTVTINFTGVNAWPALRINEWLASNGGSALDPADGKSDDWIELYNPTASAVNLTGWRIEDSGTTFTIPSGFSIPAAGYLIIWADNETVENAPATRPDLHVPFQLSASGDSITLTAPDSTVIDTVTFSSQSRDVSNGRWIGSGSTVVTLDAPTFGATNAFTPPTPAIASHVSNAQGFSMTWVTLPGAQYRFQRSSDLAQWTTLATLTAATTEATATDGAPLPTHSYYRAVLVIP